MATDIQKANEAIFATLSEKEHNVIDLVNAYTRSLMYHRFTGMPKRGLLHRMLPPIEVKTKEQWLASGVAEEDLRPINNVRTMPGCVITNELYEPWWETGSLFYEIAERRLAREDVERRLASRTLSRWEWEYEYQKQRKYQKQQGFIRDLYNTRKIENFAYNVMGKLVNQIYQVAFKEKA